MKRWITFILVAFAVRGVSQTGPAGVGSSSNNVFWVKADAGTSSTVSGSAISSWADQSGNSVVMNQTVAAQQPSFVSNVINGFPAVQFDNVSNTNDKLIGPDLSIFDNTSGYTFFTVTRPQVLDGAARVIVSKRTTVSVDQSFMLFYYTGNKLHVDIQTTDNRFNTTTAFSANNNYLIDVLYDGSRPTASRVAVYIEDNLDCYGAETATLVPDNASPLIMGTTDASDPRPYGGYIAEVILYREALGPAQRIIVNNYLSAKYNIALSGNDKYAGDNAGNGDYDRDVAGIGSESAGSSTSFSPSVSSGLGMSVASGLDAGDYVMVGHAMPTNSVNFTDVGGMTGVYNGRWDRVWYIDVTNTLTALSMNLEFDMSDGGVGTVAAATPSNYVLLYRAAQSGTWTQVTTASSVSGDRVLFNGVALSGDGYYTLGSLNVAASPLPVDLIHFSATAEKNAVELNWSTATEKNSRNFVVQRSANGIQFDDLATVAAGGNSSQNSNYNFTDHAPLAGISYYRLKQRDRNGESKLSNLVSVNMNNADLVLYPNPVSARLCVKGSGAEAGPVSLQVYDSKGQLLLGSTNENPANTSELCWDLRQRLSPGTYLVRVSAQGGTITRTIILE